MRIKTTFLLCFAALALTACFPYFTNNPPLRTITGQVTRADTGAPVNKARLAFKSGRQRGITLLPWDTFGIDAFAETDASGKFRLVAKLNAKVEVYVNSDEFSQRFDLPAFPPSNQIENLVLSLSEKNRKPPTEAR